MKAIMDWFRAHNISTHGLALAIGALAVLVETDQHIRDLLLKDLDIHPKIISSLGALGAILLAYRQPKRVDPGAVTADAKAPASPDKGATP